MPSQPTSDQARRAITAIGTGADDAQIAEFAGATPEEWDEWMDGSFGDDVHKSRADLAILAATTIRTNMRTSPAIAVRILEHEESRANLDRLKAITG
jgi:hypothetical protein